MPKTTETVYKEKINDLVTAEINYDTRSASVFCPSKFEQPFIIEKSNYQFYKVSTLAGPVPKLLEGKFSSLDAAIEFTAKYMLHAKQTQISKRKEVAERVKARKAKRAESNAKTS